LKFLHAVLAIRYLKKHERKMAKVLR